MRGPDTDSQVILSVPHRRRSNPTEGGCPTAAQPPGTAAPVAERSWPAAGVWVSRACDIVAPCRAAGDRLVSSDRDRPLPERSLPEQTQAKRSDPVSPERNGDYPGESGVGCNNEVDSGLDTESPQSPHRFLERFAVVFRD